MDAWILQLLDQKMIILAILPPSLFFTINASLSIYLGNIIALNILAFMAFLDVVFRYKDYSKLKKCKEITESHLRRFRHSMCSRFSCAAASGRFKDSMQYYRSIGYRWYHFTPDGFFSIKGNPLVSIGFWKSFFGMSRNK